jgi:hypothetical protein
MDKSKTKTPRIAQIKKLSKNQAIRGALIGFRRETHFQRRRGEAK